MRRSGFFILIVCISCTSGVTNRSDYILPTDSMAFMLAEVHKRTAIIQHKSIKGKPAEALAWRDLNQLFDSLGVPQERFDSSMNFYIKQASIMEEIYDDALALLSTELATTSPEKTDSAAHLNLSKEEIVRMMSRDPAKFQERMEELTRNLNAADSASRHGAQPPKLE